MGSRASSARGRSSASPPSLHPTPLPPTTQRRHLARQAAIPSIRQHLGEPAPLSSPTSPAVVVPRPTFGAADVAPEASNGGPHTSIGAPIYFLDAELKPVSLSTACGVAEGSGLGLSREWAEKLSRCDLEKRQVRRSFGHAPPPVLGHAPHTCHSVQHPPSAS